MIRGVDMQPVKEIKTNADAVQYLEAILNAINVLTVSGRQNCGIINAVCNDLERVANYLKQSGGEGINGKPDK